MRKLAILAAALSTLTAAAAEVPGVFALTNVRIVTAPGQTIEKGTVVVRDGTIEAVGANVAIPADAVVRDLSGKTLYPGLIDPYVTVSRLAGRKPAPEDDDDATAVGRGGGRRRPTGPLELPLGNAHP